MGHVLCCEQAAYAEPGWDVADPIRSYLCSVQNTLWTEFCSERPVNVQIEP